MKITFILIFVLALFFAKAQNQLYTVRIYKNITSEKLIIEKGDLISGVYFVEFRGDKIIGRKLILE